MFYFTCLLNVKGGKERGEKFHKLLEPGLKSITTVHIAEKKYAIV